MQTLKSGYLYFASISWWIFSILGSLFLAIGFEGTPDNFTRGIATLIEFTALFPLGLSNLITSKLIQSNIISSDVFFPFLYGLSLIISFITVLIIAKPFIKIIEKI